MATTISNPQQQAGKNLLVTTAIGVGGTILFAVVAGFSDAVGKIILAMMVGFALIFLYMHAGTLQSLLSKTGISQAASGG